MLVARPLPGRWRALSLVGREALRKLYLELSAGEAAPGEVRVTRIARDLAAHAGLRFEERATSLTGEWVDPVFRVSATSPDPQPWRRSTL